MKNSMCLRNHSHRVFHFREYTDSHFQRSEGMRSRHRQRQSYGRLHCLQVRFVSPEIQRFRVDAAQFAKRANFASKTFKKVF